MQLASSAVGITIRKFIVKTNTPDLIEMRAKMAALITPSQIVLPSDNDMRDDIRNMCANLDKALRMVSAMSSRLDLMENRFEQEMKCLRADNAALLRQIAPLMAAHSAEGGLLPEPNVISLLGIQIFHKEELTKAQRQGRHTHWSLKLEPAINGRRVKGGIDVSLYSGEEFANQMRSIRDLSISIQQHAAQTTPDTLYGMLVHRTRGAGTPRCGTQFCVLNGHLTDAPEVEVHIDEQMIACTSFRPGKGTREGHAKWFGNCKPARQS
jgi:hypothetical protein